MIDLVLKNNKVNIKSRIGIQTLISAFIIALAIALPQLVHLVAGVKGGVTYLPMYLPVILGGCILGSYYGLAIGLLSPLFSFLFTSLFNNPMPILTRLPYMIFELGLMGLISGLFSKKIYQNKWFSLIAVLTSFLIGRLSFLGISYLFQNVSELKGAQVLNQILNGYFGLLIQVILLPLFIVGIRYLIKKNNKEN